MTPRQRDALRMIQAFWKSNGYSPTIRQIASGLGLSSTSAAHGLIASLQERRLIEKLDNRARSIKITRRGYDALVLGNPRGGASDPLTGDGSIDPMAT